MRHERSDSPTHRTKKTIMFVVGFFVFMACFGAGYGLSLLLFEVTGRPGALFTHIIAGLIGLFVFMTAFRLFMRANARFKGGRTHFNQLRNRMMNDTIVALDRIAHGDFSVLIQVDEHNPFSELAESVNTMARELGTMEKLRQDFISDVSHEIQSPLTSISGFAALLKSDTLTADQRAHYIEVIETEARRLSKLSDNLLRLSSLEDGAQALRFANFSLDKQIQHAVLMLEPQWAEKQIEFSLELEKTSFEGDEGLMSQVWINLIHNAIKFTPTKGTISITLMSDSKTAVCKVADTGIGISDEDRMHVFERFYKVDKSRDRALGGSGLGLSLVKKIVELHGGMVGVQSVLGKGSTFTVQLPAKK